MAVRPGSAQVRTHDTNHEKESCRQTLPREAGSSQDPLPTTASTMRKAGGVTR